MSIDKTCITSVTSTKVAAANSSCTTCDLVALSATVNQLVMDRQSYVTLGCDLPDLNLGTTPQGTMFYVQELGVPVVATDQAWTGLDGRTYRKDIPDTTLYGWGYNYYGTIGVNTSFNCLSSPVQEITSTLVWKHINAGSITNGIKIDGTLWSWSRNNYGQLGDVTTICRSSPVQEITSSTNWCELTKGGSLDFAFGIKTNGSLYGWGNNVCGVLGNQSSINASSPVQEISSSAWSKVASGRCHALGIKTDGSLWAWGHGECGKLGNNIGSLCSYSSPVQETSLSTNWCYIAGAWQNSLGIKTDGTLWGWGMNFCGSNGDGTSTKRSSPVQEISSSTNWTQVSASNYKTNALNSLGQIFSFGYNAFGELGTGVASFGTNASPLQEITSSTSWCGVDSGFCHVSAIKTDGTIWGWGNGSGFAIGDGTVICRSSPVQELTSATDWYCVSTGVLYTMALKCVP